MQLFLKQPSLYLAEPKIDFPNPSFSLTHTHTHTPTPPHTPVWEVLGVITVTERVAKEPKDIRKDKCM